MKKLLFIVNFNKYNELNLKGLFPVLIQRFPLQNITNKNLNFELETSFGRVGFIGENC
jgi:hypothetical protein